MAANRTAIVTGGGKRVGAFIAASLLADGWSVIAHVHREGDAVPDGAIKAVAESARREVMGRRRSFRRREVSPVMVARRRRDPGPSFFET